MDKRGGRRRKMIGCVHITEYGFSLGGQVSIKCIHTRSREDQSALEESSSDFSCTKDKPSEQYPDCKFPVINPRVPARENATMGERAGSVSLRVRV